MRDILLTLTIFGSVPLILVKPYIGVLVFSWISYMNPHRLTWGFAYDFQFAFLIGAVTVLAWIISREPKRLPWNGVTLLLIAFTLWISFTTLFALYPDPAYGKWEQTMKILLFNGFVTIGLMRGKQRLNALIWVIALSIGFFGVKGGIFTVRSGGVDRVFGPPGSFISDNNHLGLALLMIIPLVHYLRLSTTNRWLRVVLMGINTLNVISIFGTHSRGALVGMAAMAMMMLVKSRRRLAFGIGLVVLGIIGFTIMPESWHSRMQKIVEYQDDASAEGRFRAWTYGIDLALDRPVLGGGFMAFLGNKDPTSRLGYRTSHSAYFQVLGEHGFIGFGLFISLLVATYLLGLRIRRRALERSNLLWAADLAHMVQVSLVSFAIAGAFVNLAFFDLLYHIVAIMVLTDAVVKDALQAEEGKVLRSVSEGHRQYGR